MVRLAFLLFRASNQVWRSLLAQDAHQTTAKRKARTYASPGGGGRHQGLAMTLSHRRHSTNMCAVGRMLDSGAPPPHYLLPHHDGTRRSFRYSGCLSICLLSLGGC